MSASELPTGKADRPGVGVWLALGGFALMTGAALLLWAAEGSSLFVEAAFGALMNCF